MTVLVLARLSTRNFDFEALGRDRGEVEKALRAGLAVHCDEYDADPEFFEELLNDDEVTYMPIEVGKAYRDGEEIKTPLEATK